MTAKEIQELVFNQCGLKTSVKKGTGSMRGYVIIWPIFQNGSYPSIPSEVVANLKEKLKEFDGATKPLFCGHSDISVYGIAADCIKFKKESKPKEIEQQKARTWGSKNSQLRLDKTAARYAKKAKKGNTVRYW